MPGYDHLIAFLIATALFAAIPGPAVLYTAAQTLARGRRAGFLTVFGIHAGCYVHVFAASLGLSAVLTHVPLAYLVLKLFGAAYLVWIGITIIMRKGEATLPEIARKSSRRAFIDSMIVEILNPKAALFFIAFLPQFVDPAASLPVWLQFLILGTIVNVLFSLADIVTVLAASAVVGRLQKSGRVERIIRIGGGSILVGLGVKLAADRT
ncbi:MAG: LysE family translocator [Beijerinckiaceae bacterium]|nr:LysE family translocator [Beijerinckiaceae bacterium]